MGQQQLLLVILVTIIVGISTVVAINTFGSAAEGAMRDAVRLDLLGAAGTAQSYFIRPTMLGGGGRNYSTIDFSRFHFPGRIVEGSNNLVTLNDNARYIISDQTASEFIITAFIEDGKQTTVAARVCRNTIRLGDFSFGTAPAPPACN